MGRESMNDEEKAALIERILHHEMTAADCELVGGHCWEVENIVVATNPPRFHRRCIHCHKVQEGVWQEPMRWYDDP